MTDSDGLDFGMPSWPAPQVSDPTAIRNIIKRALEESNPLWTVDRVLLDVGSQKAHIRITERLPVLTFNVVLE